MVEVDSMLCSERGKTACPGWSKDDWSKKDDWSNKKDDWSKKDDWNNNKAGNV